MSSRPLVSIVIPVYNGANFLADAIDSALGQTYPDIEVIVVDDGSTDDGATAAVARGYGERIRYARQPNGGVAAALNHGVELMNGELFSWLSHDDIYLADKVERQVDAWSAFGQRCVVIGDYERFDDAGSAYRVTTDKFNLVARPLDAVFRGLINGCALLVPHSLFEDVGVFEPGLPTTQDYFLWYRMARKVPFVQCLHAGVRQRMHPLQGSRQVSHLDEAGRMFSHLLDETPPEIMRGYSGSEARFLLEVRPAMVVYPGALAHLERRLREVLRRDVRYGAVVVADCHPRQTKAAVERLARFAVPPVETVVLEPASTGVGDPAALVGAAVEAVTGDWILVQSARRVFDQEQLTAVLEHIVRTGADIASPSPANDGTPGHGLMFRRKAAASAARVWDDPAAAGACPCHASYQPKQRPTVARQRLASALKGSESVRYGEGIAEADLLAALTDGFAEDRPVILLLMHTIGGGSQTHVFHFATALARHANVLLAYGDHAAVRLSRSPADPRGGIVFDWAEACADLVPILHLARLARVDIHSVFGFRAEADALLDALAVPYDLTVLDYDLFARHPHLAASNGRFVGDHQLSRQAGGILLPEPDAIARKASRIITLCRDTAARLERVTSGLAVIAPEHWQRPAMTVRHVLVPRPRPGEPLRVLVAGTIDRRKGSDLVIEAACLANRRKLPIRFEILGKLMVNATSLAQAGEALVEHGPYDRSSFAAKVAAAAPHLGWVPTQVPETWCYVLSELFELAMPVAATSIGALRERCQGRSSTWLLPYDATAEMWIDLFLRLRASDLTLAPLWPSIDDLPPARPFYFDGYLEPAVAPVDNRAALIGAPPC